jgi:hypothetical protein
MVLTEQEIQLIDCLCGGKIKGRGVGATFGAARDDITGLKF